MSVSDWERQRTLDKMFAHVPSHQRNEFIERMKKEQDDMDKKNGDSKNVSVSAPKKPFLKKKGTATGQAKKAGKAGDGDKKSSDDKTPKPSEGVYEVVTGQLGAITPRPMQVDTLPGTEVRDTQSNSATTSPGGEDQHTHTAYYDEAGNGYTAPDDTGHTHEVRSFQVVDYQHPDGEMSHGHPGVLPRPERTPGSEYKPYYGIL